MAPWLVDRNGNKLRPGERMVDPYMAHYFLSIDADYIDDDDHRVMSGSRSKGRPSPFDFEDERARRWNDHVGVARNPNVRAVDMASYYMAQVPFDEIGGPQTHFRQDVVRHPVQPFAARKIQRAWKEHKTKRERSKAALLSVMSGRPGSAAHLPEELRRSVHSAAGFRSHDKIGLAGAGMQRSCRRRAARATGSRAQVWHGKARRTAGGLTKSMLTKNKAGRIVSRKVSARARHRNGPADPTN